MSVIPNKFYEIIDYPRATFTIVRSIGVVEDGTVMVEKASFDPATGKPTVCTGEGSKSLRPLPPEDLSQVKVENLIPTQKVEVIDGDCHRIGTIESIDGKKVWVKLHGGDARAKLFPSRLLRPRLRFNRARNTFSVI